MNTPSHAVMFHHFHDESYPKGQGAISADDFILILNEVEKTHPLIDAKDWLQLATEDKLIDEVCLTFDDGLACQYDIAFPILKEKGLSAFWFIYSSILDGQVERLEKYRHFRTTKFKSVNQFYHHFFNTLEKKFEFKDKVEGGLEKFNEKDYLKEFPFYTREDKKFRYIRDRLLNVDEYFEIMEFMIKDSGYQILVKDLWIDKKQVRSISEDGHIIGLHSHTHPTQLAALSKVQQFNEYIQNKKQIESVTGEVVVSMSHPCNSYTDETLKILNSLGIQVGFCSNMSEINKKGLEFPREDHVNILNRVNS